MSETKTDDVGGWFSPEDFAVVRRRMPILYVDAIPVLVDADGVIQRIALLLRTPREGGISRALVSGRVMYH